jgi:putative membrane protein
MDLVLAHWSASWPAILGYLAVAAAHLTGLHRMLAARAGAAGPPGRPELLREAAAFHGGLLCALAALVSPVAYWSAAYLWVRGVQGLMLAFVAAPLIVAGAPRLVLRAGWPRQPRGEETGRPASRGYRARMRTNIINGKAAGPVAIPWWLGWPAAVTVAFNLAWLGWQRPALVELAAGNDAARWAEYACYLGGGIAFWLQLIGSRPLRPLRPLAGPLRRVGFATATAGAIAGMILAFGARVLYPAYGGAAAHQVLTRLDDQQLVGAVLWMGMLPTVTVAAVALLIRWLSDEESAAVTAGLDRLLMPRRSAWPSRPGIR